MGWSAQDVSPLSEPVAAPLIHCDGIGPICVRNGNVHVVIWAEQITPEGETERIITGRLVAPTDKARENLSQIAMALAGLLVSAH